MYSKKFVYRKDYERKLGEKSFYSNLVSSIVLVCLVLVISLLYLSRIQQDNVTLNQIF